MFPLAAIEAIVGRAFAVRADAEQRAEGVERVEAAVKAERKLVEVGLQMLRLDAAVVRPLSQAFRLLKTKWMIGRYSSATLGSPPSTTGKWA